MSFVDGIYNYRPKNEQEIQDKKVILDCINLFPKNILLRENEIAHFTGSGFILNQKLDKVLMIHHNIRNTWAWTGGHVDGNDDFLDVAMKEAFEETGVTVTPLSTEIASVDILTASGHIKNGKFINSHLHLSVAYLLIANENEIPSVKSDENSAVKWFQIEEINSSLFTSRDVYLYTKLLQRAKAMNISLKKADFDDCAEIHAMQGIAFKPLLDIYQDYDTNPRTETMERIQQRMQTPSITHFFILLQSKKIGHIRIHQLDERTCRLGQMFILPVYQGNGYAQQAISLVEMQYPTIKRWVLDTIKQEEKLRHLYEKMGYLLTGEEKSIKPGMDLIYYAKGSATNDKNM